MPDRWRFPYRLRWTGKNTPATASAMAAMRRHKFLLVEEYHHDKRSQHRIHEMKGGGPPLDMN